MNKLGLGAAILAFVLLQGVFATTVMAEVREVVIVGTFKKPSGQLEDIVYKTNAEFFGCRQALPGLRINLQMQIQGYVESQGWRLQDARCAFRTKAGTIEEFNTRGQQ